MGQSRRGARLAKEQLAQLALGGEVRRQDLDRHMSIETDVTREKHRPHPAATELALDGVL